MIHVLILLCQGPRAASITLCPCLLLALSALTEHSFRPIKKNKKNFLLLSATLTLSWYWTPDSKSCFLQHRLPYFALYQPFLSLLLHPCILPIACFCSCQPVFRGESVFSHMLGLKFALWSILIYLLIIFSTNQLFFSPQNVNTKSQLTRACKSSD